MPYYDDNGNEVFPDIIRKPMLCLVCRVNRLGDGMDAILCSMNRHDQREDAEFYCGAFRLDDGDGDVEGPRSAGTPLSN